MPARSRGYQDARAESARVIDHLIGAMVAAGREDSGLTPKQLAAKAGVSLADLKQYEQGAARISPSDLLEIAEALDTPISYFFSAMDIADCAGLDGSGSRTIGPTECACIIQIFSQFRSPAAFDAAVSMARSMVVLEDRLNTRSLETG